jgi:K+-sensing histidine kinase KdpD
MFANHVAIAIENARLFQNLKFSIAEKLKLQEEIYRERIKVEIERETNRLREDLVQYLVHELRNPLTIVYSTFGLLREMVERVMVQPDEKKIVDAV